MNRYKPGDFIVAGVLGDVNVYVNVPGPSLEDTVSRTAGRFGVGSIGMIISVVSDDCLFVTVNDCSGFVMSRMVRLLEK